MRLVVALALALAGLSCTPEVRIPENLDHANWEVINWGEVEDLPRTVALLESVFWEPDDTISLRKLIRETQVVEDKTVLEIGTGSGLLSLCSLQYGAANVIATDVNPAAVANARYNAERMGLAERFEVRRVPLSDRGAFTVIEQGEAFDVIISNPPWVDQTPAAIDEFALYDEGFYLMRSLLEGLREHLNPGGTALLAYGSVSGIRALLRMSSEMKLKAEILDERDLDELEEEFLPGMLIEVKPGS